ncbi:hypothetical protein LDENG_00225020 [Lucifuga dentata]|nr:hypothetical protein LDENG_00225020 [Lucifuga dentata]
MTNQTQYVVRPAQANKYSNADLCTEMTSQLENLFSNEHLAEDGFLLKKVLTNKHGYISLKLLTRFKKIKLLTTDMHVTLAGALRSELLEVNRKVWILDPGKELPNELQRYAKYHTQLSCGVCAVVKFDSLEGA